MASLLSFARANEESKTKSLRAIKNWEKARSEGKVLKVCPAWLRVVDGQYEIIPERKRIIERVFTMAAEGASNIMITRTLNHEGVPSFGTDIEGKVRTGPRGSGWHATRIYRILRDESVLGVWQPMRLTEDGKSVPAGEPIENHFPPAITHDLWRRASVARRTNPSRGNRGAVYRNLLSGLCRCGSCGGAMKMTTAGSVAEGMRYYLHCAPAAKANGCTDRSHWNYPLIERAILDHVGEFKLAELFQTSEADETLAALGSQIGRLNDEIAGIERRKERARSIILDAEADDPLVAEMKAALRKMAVEQEDLKQALANTRETHADLMVRRSNDTDAEAEVVRLRDALAGDLPDEERLEVRSKLALALKSFIFEVQFSSKYDVIDVVMIGALRVYRFKYVKPKRGHLPRLELVERMTLDDVYGQYERGETPYTHPGFVYAGGDFHVLGAVKEGQEDSFRRMLAAGP
jgi:hypothetical protein